MKNFYKRKKSIYKLSNIFKDSEISSDDSLEKEINIPEENIREIDKQDIVNSAFYLSRIKAKNLIEENDIKREKRVLIYYSCGSIGMSTIPNSEGLFYQKNFLFNLISNHFNFCDKEFTINNLNPNMNVDGFLATPNTIFNKRIFYKINEAEEIIDSNSITLDVLKKLGRVIRNNYEDYDAFIILHGLDTITYTASVLSFMLENLSKPVIITGSQIPLSIMRNDSQNNLINSLHVAGFFNIPEVCFLYGTNLFRGNRTIRNKCIGIDLFESPNLPPLADFDITIKFNLDIVMKMPSEPFTFFDDFNSNICTIKIFPMMDHDTFASCFQPPIEAVILETYGVGNLPLNRQCLLDVIKKASERGVIIMNVSQCRKGAVTSYYEAGNYLEKIGVIFAGDITIECALAKLSYLLGKKYDKKTIHKLLKENIRGELTDFKEEFFSSQSNSFVNSILDIMDLKNNDEDKYLIYTSLIPSVINEFISNQNLDMLRKFENEIRHLNANEFCKESALHIAARIGNEKIVEFLLKFKNINVNLIDYKKMTPLNYACLHKNYETARIIYEKGGLLSDDTSLKLGGLFCKLAYKGELENLKLFFKCGANLMTKDYEGRTVAHLAACEGKIEIFKFLHENTNYDLNVIDTNGRTPLDDSVNEEISNLLILRYGCKKNMKKRIKIRKTL